MITCNIVLLTNFLKMIRKKVEITSNDANQFEFEGERSRSASCQKKTVLSSCHYQREKKAFDTWSPDYDTVSMVRSEI